MSVTRKAFEQTNVLNTLHVVGDASRLGFLRRQGKYADAVRPGSSCSTSIFPANGFEYSRNQDRRRLRRLPVIMLKPPRRR